MSDKSFVFDFFLIGSFFAIAICNIFDKIEQHDDENKKYRSEIKELISRLEECEKNHESSHELKK